MRPRQVRYQAALRPDWLSSDSTAIYNLWSNPESPDCAKTVSEFVRLHDSGTAVSGSGRMQVIGNSLSFRRAI